jgi:tetratricopeptide (TPR) repeat protein
MKATILNIIILITVLVCSCQPDKSSLKEMKEKGIREFYKGDYQAAIQIFSECIEKDTSNPEIFFFRGSAYFNSKEVAKALADFNTAIRQSPKYADAYSTRGDIYSYLGKKDEACRDYKEAERLGKSNMRDKVRYCP